MRAARVYTVAVPESKWKSWSKPLREVIMLKISKFLIATALATLIAAPALAQSLAYVGNSDAKFVGSGGVLDFHAACNDTFPGSQFCTSEDIIRGGARSPLSPTIRRGSTRLWWGLIPAPNSSFCTLGRRFPAGPVPLPSRVNVGRLVRQIWTGWL